MKLIIYTSADGGVTVVGPAEGARLARYITLADGTVVRPDDKSAKNLAVPVDRLLRSWPIPGATAEWAETEDEFIERVAKKSVPKGTTYQVVEESAIPADRTFRGAWKIDAQAVVHDMDKCRTIHRDRLREVRAPKLAQADAQFFKALEGWLKTQPNLPAGLASIMARKQALRDATDDPAIDAASTPEALKAALPAALAE